MAGNLPEYSSGAKKMLKNFMPRRLVGLSSSWDGVVALADANAAEFGERKLNARRKSAHVGFFVE
jgi:hypothetical protein